MFIIFIVLSLIYGMLFFLSRKEEVAEELVSSKLQKPFVKIGAWIYHKADYRVLPGRGWKTRKISGSIFEREQVQDDLRALKPAIPIMKSTEQYYISKLGMASMVLIIGTFLAGCIYISNEMSHILKDGVYISRSEYDGLTQNVEITANIENLETEDVSLEIGSRQYTEQELDAMYEDMLPVLEKSMLAKNDSVETISSNLEYPSKLSGYPFTLKWSSEGSYLDVKGRIRADYEKNEKVLKEVEIGKDGVLDTLTVKIFYNDYKKEYSFPIRIIPREKSVQELMREDLNTLLKQAEEDSITEEYIRLPEQVADYHVEWQEKKKNLGGIFLGCIGAAFVILYIGKDRDLHSAVMKREQQLLADYPEIVSKVSLLTGAGMTVRNAWKKIACDYREKREQGFKVHYAYEEMLIAVYEMDSGVSEADAYENFGKRCKLQHYVKFTTLLTQNLKKGAAGLFQILQEEAASAFEIRKSIARKLGEEAGTKLLFPMMIMLGIVMIMIFYPAFSSYAS